MDGIYCVKDKRKTPNKPGSEQIVKTKNNRLMLKAVCSICNNVKTQFVKKSKN